MLPLPRSINHGLFNVFLKNAGFHRHAAGTLTGISVGGAAVLGAMVASASYIAAPAAVSVALPTANPGLYLTASLAITFPLNLTIGIPVYYQAAQLMAR